MLVIFVTPYFTDSSRLFLRKLAEQPGVRLAAMAQEDVGVLPPELRQRITRFERVQSALRADDVTEAAKRISAAEGPIHRLIGVMEQVQESVAEARDRLDVPGLRLAQALNFRDKTRMKDLLRAADVPVARHRLVKTLEEARGFVAEVGYPVVVKPPAGAASQETFRVQDDHALRQVFGTTTKAAGGVALLEEFVTGQECSFDAFIKDGRVVYYSVSNYYPSCLEAMQNPWIQWCIVLRRDYQSEDIAAIGQKMLNVLGLETGMCHGEWFRRKDGSVVISEAAARPPGAMLPTLIARAHDVDCVGAWARLMTTGEFDPFPPRIHATGAAFLRGQGQGRVRAVHGLDRIWRDLGGLITDTRLPSPGQEKGRSYEGEGVICLRHPDTNVVQDALKHIITTVRVELG
ncbi:MAG: ATP-grasp domain-containing protein [Myxococcota bacterium]